MQDPKIFISISKHFSGEETQGEKAEFLAWLNQNEDHKILFDKIKSIYQEEPLEEETNKPFVKKLNKETVKDFVINQALGNFVGFVVGMSVTQLFTHHVLEKRGFNNLFGLAGRKKVVVNDIPEWLQWTISAIVGYIALEYINHLVQTKKHIRVWNYVKKRLAPVPSLVRNLKLSFFKQQ